MKRIGQMGQILPLALHHSSCPLSLRVWCCFPSWISSLFWSLLLFTRAGEWKKNLEGRPRSNENANANVEKNALEPRDKIHHLARIGRPRSHALSPVCERFVIFCQILIVSCAGRTRREDCGRVNLGETERSREGRAINNFPLRPWLFLAAPAHTHTHTHTHELEWIF